MNLLQHHQEGCIRSIETVKDEVHIYVDVRDEVRFPCPDCGELCKRAGYYVLDKDSTPEKPVFNKTTSLKDSYKPE